MMQGDPENVIKTNFHPDWRRCREGPIQLARSTQILPFAQDDKSTSVLPNCTTTKAGRRSPSVESPAC